MKQVTAEIGRNWAAQPSLEYTATNWSPYGSAGATGQVMTTGGRYGAKFYRLTFPITTTGNNGRYHDEPGPNVKAGETWTASTWVRPSVALSLRMNMEFRTASALIGATVQGQNITCPANVWTRLHVTGVAAGDATMIRMQNYAFSASIPAGTTYDIDAAMISKGELGDYYDGDTADTATRLYSWAGSPGNSASIESEILANLVAEPLEEGPWAGVTVQGLEDGNQVITIWRTIEGRRTAVRGAQEVTVLDSAYFIDYETPPGWVVTYDVEVITGADVGAVVPAATVTLPYDSGFIHDPRNPTAFVAIQSSVTTGGQPVFSGGAFQKLSRAADVELHNIVGAPEPVAIAGQRRSPAGVDLSLLTDAETENTRLRDMLESSILVVRLPPGWVSGFPPVAYVAFPEVVEIPPGAPENVGGYFTQWELIGTTVKGSTARVLVSLFTYDDVTAIFATYDQKQAAAAGMTYLEDQKNPFNA